MEIISRGVWEEVVEGGRCNLSSDESALTEPPSNLDDISALSALQCIPTNSKHPKLHMKLTLLHYVVLWEVSARPLMASCNDNSLKHPNEQHNQPIQVLRTRIYTIKIKCCARLYYRCTV